MNLASKTAPVPSTMPSNVAAIQRLTGWKHLALHLGDDLAGVAFVPVPVEVLGHGAKLDDQVV